MIGSLLKLVVTLIAVELRNEAPKLARGVVRRVKRALGEEPEKPKGLTHKEVQHIQQQIKSASRPLTIVPPPPKGDRKP